MNIVCNLKYILTLTAVLIMFNSEYVKADSLDDFKTIIDGGRFNIVYEIEEISLMNKDTKRDKLQVASKIKADNKIPVPPHIIVCDGVCYYSEVNAENLSSEVSAQNVQLCALRQGNKLYRFSVEKIKINGKMFKTKYYPYIDFSQSTGDKKLDKQLSKEYFKSKIRPTQYTESDYKFLFLEPYMRKAVSALLPNYSPANSSSVYKQVNSGTNEEGFTYFDYKAEPKDENDQTVDIIRYYFDDNKPVKIAFANYRIDKNGQRKGKNCVITIAKFSNIPDKNYLQLPTQLKEVK